MPEKIYYIFLDHNQWEALKQICESYFRSSNSSGFQQMAHEKVQNARFFQEINIEWGKPWEEWEKTTGTSINEPEWSFMWAMRELKSMEHNIRTLMAKFLGLKIKYENVEKELVDAKGTMEEKK